VYQPQIDSWDGFRVDGRASIAVNPNTTANAPAIYGIVTLSAQAHIDKDAALVSLEKITVKTASFPGSADKAHKWATAIQSNASKLKPIALERFQAALAVTAAERAGDAVPVKNDPPVIEISTVPSMLVLIDGEPVFREVAGTTVMRVLNTRPLILRATNGTHYLKLFDGWMQAQTLTGDWTVSSSVPPELNTALQRVIALKTADLLIGGDPRDPNTAPSLKRQAPKIVVATKPTELIVFEGEPQFTPVTGTKLIYATNTTGHVFVHAEDQKAYALVTGRWFAGPSTLKGPWAFVPGDQLPADFPLIPDDSPVENVKASVPGTEQAEEVVVANSIPQTAQVTRSTATFTPSIDGAPKIAPIDGTQLHYIANSSQPIVVLGSPAEYWGVQNVRTIRGPLLR
jgi:hypothetical protein